MAFLMAAVLLFSAPASAGSKIKILVNNEPITTYDIARRAAFFKLRRIRGNRTKLATEELIDEAIKMQAAKRVKMIVGNKEVDAAYARFAKSNKMPVKVLTRILNRSGVTRAGFRKYIRAQMSWQRVLAAKQRFESSKNSTKGIFLQLHSQGKGKPSTTEYTLQQIIFVVPKAKRGALMSRRRREARAFRNRFESCANTIQFAKGLKDVTVRSLGRIMQPQLPPDWKKQVMATSQGKTTKIRDTHRGVEFLAVCGAKVVSDDRVAQLDFQANQAKKGISESEKKYISQLREKATIVHR
jgi:peptidyl-prolyl cis-trans isomerase SurA